MLNLMARLALYANTPLPMASACTLSQAQEFFMSGEFAEHIKNLEAKQKVQAALFARFDAVLKGMNMLGKIFSRVRR